MNISESLFLGWTISIAISLSGLALAQSNTEAQRAAVVKLHTHFATGKKDETAAGLFVGKDQQYAYFITARHAVADEVDNQEVHAQSTELWFYGRAQSLKAQVFEHTDAILDLGVVYLLIADLPATPPQIVKRDAAVNVAVVVVGHPAAGDWSVWQGTVLNENAPNGDVHHFVTSSNPSLAHGDSGGPVFDPDGNFLGMHTETTTSYGTAAKSGEIVVQLGAWHVPTNNLVDVPLVSDPEAIKRVLLDYEEAYNQRDAGALWKIWPNPLAKTKNSIELAFQNARSIEMQLHPSQPQIAADGLRATVKCRLSQSYTPKNGNPQPLRNDEIVISLKKNNGLWTIIEIK